MGERGQRDKAKAVRWGSGTKSRMDHDSAPHRTRKPRNLGNGLGPQDGPNRWIYWRAGCRESVQVRFGGGRLEKGSLIVGSTSLAAYPTCAISRHV